MNFRENVKNPIMQRNINFIRELTSRAHFKGEVPLSMQRENIFFAKKIFFAILQLKYIAFALKLTNVLKLTVLHSFPTGKNVPKVQNIC